MTKFDQARDEAAEKFANPLQLTEQDDPYVHGKIISYLRGGFLAGADWAKSYEIEDKWKTLWENQGDTLGRRIQELVAELREAKAEYKRLRDELDTVKL